MISPGTYVEYIQDKRLVSAVCLRQDKPGRIFVRTDKGREEKLAESKCLFPVSGFANPNTSYDELRTMLLAAGSRREETAQAINLAELWELLLDETTGTAWSLRDLCDLALGETDPQSNSAMYRALEKDSTYFLRKSDSYVLRPQEQVQEILLCRQAEATNRLEHGIVLEWLRGLWDSPETTAPIVFPSECPETAQRVLNWFKDVGIFGSEAKRYKEVQALLQELEITRKDAVFRLLVKNGIWNEHENILLHKYSVPIDFAPEVLEEAQTLSQSNVEQPDDTIREDWSHLECFSVDDASTTEIDDALSFEELENGHIRVGVHIADASHYVLPSTLVDQEAFDRATAIYLPDLKVRMVPHVLSDTACSLVAGQNRRALSFFAEFDSQYQRLSTRITPSWIRVTHRLTYVQTDELMQQGHYAGFLALAKKSLALRQEAGAMTVPFPRINVSVSAEGEITIEREAPSGPSQILVSEMMILANSMAGDYLNSKQAPAIYRSQEQPSKPLEEMPVYDPVKAYVSRRYMRKGTLSLTPGRHYGLGLDNYVQVTSPIRRYNDLLMQRQLKELLLSDAPLYTDVSLQALLIQTKSVIANADLIERDRRSYWLLRYLEKHLWEEVEAVVVANHPDKHIVQLCETLIETDCPLVPGHPLPPGTKLMVRIELVWPRDHSVRVTPILDQSSEE